MKPSLFALASGVIGATFAAASTALAQVGDIPDRGAPYYYGHDMMFGSGQWGGFGMVLGPVFMILIVVGIIAGVIYLVRRSDGAGTASSHAGQDRALALLKERYARGEIDSAEFTERKRLLTD